MGNKVVWGDGKTLEVDDKEYKLTPGLVALITLKHPRPNQWNDYQVYKELVTQTKVKSFPNRTGNARPHVPCQWKHMLKKMVIPGDRIVEDTASIGNIGESPPGSSRSCSSVSSRRYKRTRE